jgi:hypothetical protein
MSKYALIENTQVVAIIFNTEILDSNTNYVELSESQYETLGNNFMDFKYIENNFVYSPPINEITVEPIEENEL